MYFFASLNSQNETLNKINKLPFAAFIIAGLTVVPPLTVVVIIREFILPLHPYIAIAMLFSWIFFLEYRQIKIKIFFIPAWLFWSVGFVLITINQNYDVKQMLIDLQLRY